MADFGSTLKGIWMKGMEAIGNTASNIATNTKSKVDEMNLVNRRNEILKDFGNKAYALWQKGEKFPGELTEQMEELSRLDEQLNDLRAERVAMVKTQQEDVKPGPEKEEMPREEEKNEVPAEPDTADSDKTDAIAEAENAETSEPEPSEAEVPVIRVENTSVGEAIDDLFDQIPSAEEAAEKVGDALDTLEKGLKSFSDTLDEKINDLNEKISGDKTE